MTEKIVKLPENLSNDQASALHEQIASLFLDDPETIILQANEVKVVEVSAIQVLLAFFLECNERKMTVKIVDLSSEFATTIKNLNLSAAFAL